MAIGMQTVKFADYWPERPLRCLSNIKVLKQLDAIAESGGLVGLNFGVYDLREDWDDNPDTSIETMIRHIDHLVAHLGIDGVVLGTDFDGTRVPNEIGDAAGLPKLIDALRMHGYDDNALRKIGYENWLRVLSQTWK